MIAWKQDWQGKLSLGFLDEGKSYTADMKLF